MDESVTRPATRKSGQLVLALVMLSAVALGGLLLELIPGIWFGHDAGAIDVQMQRWLHGLRTPWLDRVFLAVTQLGNGEVLLGVCIVIGFWLLLARRIVEVLLIAGFVGGAAASVMVLKWLLVRSRPEPALALLAVDNPAFPSAHASMSLVVYVLAAYLIARRLQRPGVGRSVVAGGLVLALLIGLSRLYLGVHWLSDVLGGYALGGLWLAALVAILERQRCRRCLPSGD